MESPFQHQSAQVLKQFAEQACKAQLAALRSTTEIQQLYVKAMESQAKSGYDFATNTMDAREFKDLAAMWPSVLTYLRDSVEAAYTTNRQIWEVVQKATKELADMASASAQAATDAAGATLASSTGKKG